jgi:hypothetical protein
MLSSIPPVVGISTWVVAIVIAMIANWQLTFIVLCFLPCVIARSYTQTRLTRGFGADAKVLFLFTAIVSLYRYLLICSFSWQSYHSVVICWNFL